HRRCFCNLVDDVLGPQLSKACNQVVVRFAPLCVSRHDGLVSLRWNEVMLRYDASARRSLIASAYLSSAGAHLAFLQPLQRPDESSITIPSESGFGMLQKSRRDLDEIAITNERVEMSCQSPGYRPSPNQQAQLHIGLNRAAGKVRRRDKRGLFVRN